MLVKVENRYKRKPKLNKRRQKLKRKKTVETYDNQSTDESEDDQCPQMPLPSAGPDM